MIEQTDYVAIKSDLEKRQWFFCYWSYWCGCIINGFNLHCVKSMCYLQQSHM